MDFEIPASLLQPLMQAIDAASPLACRLHELGACHGQVAVPSALFDAHSLNTLYQLSQSGNERALMFQMLALDNIYNAPQARTIPALDQLVPGLVAYLTRDAIDGWLYRRNKDGTLLPWLVQGLRYVEPDQGRPYVVIDLLANTMQSANSARNDPQLRRSGMTYSLVINRHDIVNRSIPALLAEFGFYKECREFKREYDDHAALFLQFQPRFGAQFVASHACFIELEGERGKVELTRIVDGGAARCINDEELLERRFDTASDADFWRGAGIDTGFERIPLHCYISVFHLEWHRAIWVHVQHLQPYRYRPELRDKLVLPGHHRDLIDILTSSMDVFADDFVPGKSGTQAFAELAKEGVKVRILTNALEATDVAAVHAGYAKWRKPLLEAGVTLYESRRSWDENDAREKTGRFGSSASSLHAKTFAVDDQRIFVGSFNFDPRSIDLNTEMGLVIDSPALAGKLGQAMRGSIPQRAYQVLLQPDGTLYWIARDAHGGITRYDTEPGTSMWKRMGVAILSVLPIDWLL